MTRPRRPWTEAAMWIGYLINATSNDGYNGTIQISVGITNEGALTGIGFLTLAETPGLGMKADEPDFKGQFTGKTADIFEGYQDGALR